MLLPLDLFTVVLNLTNADSVDVALSRRGMFGSIPFYTGSSITNIDGKPAHFVVADTPTGRVIQVSMDVDVK